MFTSARKSFLFFMALVCLLGVLGFGQNAQSPVTTDDFSQFTWRWVGPQTFSGRITSFAVPKGQAVTYYVLTASGGLWKTTDAGTHFEPIFEHYGTLGMGYMAIAPSNPDILYLGTGEPMHARASTHGNGMWKSTDAGKTWAHIGLEKSQYIPKVEVDAKNPDIVYAAAEGNLYDNEMTSERGLFKTTDGGKSWTNLGPMKDRGVADVVIDPRNSNIVITSAYKTYRRAWTYWDRWPGNDIYKSIDGGKTWKKSTNGLPANTDLGRAGFALFEKNPSIIYARLGQGVSIGFAERDGAANFRAATIGGGRGGGGGGGGRGGGAGGTVVFPENYTFDQFRTFKVNPDLAKLTPKFTPIAAANEAELVTKLNEMVQDKDFLTKNGIDIVKLDAAARKVYAKDNDILDSINEIEKLMKKEAPAADSTEAKGRYQIINRHALEILYANALTILEPTRRNGAVYRTDDLGETWKLMTEYKQTGGSAQINQTEDGYYGRIIVDQTNDQVLYCGDTATTVSRDGGRTFTNSTWDRGIAMPTHVDHRGLWIDPANPNHILDGNDGGVCETWDGGKHFSQKATISAQQFFDVAVDNEQPYNVMGGTQDNGCWMGPSQTRNRYGIFGADWRYLPTGDGFYAVRDWWNSEWIYYESQFGASSRMNLKTGETSSLQPRPTPEQTAAGLGPFRFQWNAPIVLSPHNPGIVYVCSQFVHRSLSRGDQGTFMTISPDLSKADKNKLAEARKTNLQWATIYSFAESVKKPGLYWAGTDDGNVQTSADGGANWINITNKFYDVNGKAKPGIKGDLIPYDRWVKAVVPSAFDEKTCYVGFSGYRSHNEDKTWLYVTKDSGETWTDISQGMNNPIFEVKEDPENANVLYLATDSGIYVTIDQGKTWTRFADKAAPDVTIRSLSIQKRDREMAIGTYGRGIYVTDIGPFKEFKPEIFQEAAHLFDIKNTIRWNRFEMRGDTLGELAKADNPPVGANIYYYLKADAQNVKMTIKDLEGTTIFESTPSSKKGLQKVLWGLNRSTGGGAPAGGPGGRGGGGGGRGGGGGGGVENGVYKVTLTVDGKDVETKKMTLLPDPMFK